MQFAALAQVCRNVQVFAIEAGANTYCLQSVRDDWLARRSGDKLRLRRFAVLHDRWFCLALIEIVNSCNLPCPTCYANSPIGIGGKADAVPLDDLKRRIQGVIDRKGAIEILQLSGGEPTLHPQFFELLRWLQEHQKIDYVLLNTNGVRIARDAAFARELGAAFRYGAFQLYLQFDGAQQLGQRFLRGADLRPTRERCIKVCEEMKLPITLAMTVTPENLPFLWDAIEFGLRFPNVRGISFQPMFTSGRVPETALLKKPQARLQRPDDGLPLP